MQDYNKKEFHPLDQDFNLYQKDNKNLLGISPL